jgi:hypothetical protein
MRQERAEGAGGDLLVPMAWMHAEYVADELLRSGALMPPTTLEYRAGRGALALTVFLSEGPPGGALTAAGTDEWRSLTAYGTAWRAWVCERLDLLVAADFESGGGRAPDLELAAVTWRWLEETELLAPDLDAVAARARGRAAGPEQECPQVWTPAWQLGLPLGHLSMHLY